MPTTHLSLSNCCHCLFARPKIGRRKSLILRNWHGCVPREREHIFPGQLRQWSCNFCRKFRCLPQKHHESLFFFEMMIHPLNMRLSAITALPPASRSCHDQTLGQSGSQFEGAGHWDPSSWLGRRCGVHFLRSQKWWMLWVCWWCSTSRSWSHSCS